MTQTSQRAQSARNKHVNNDTQPENSAMSTPKYLSMVALVAALPMITGCEGPDETINPVTFNASATALDCVGTSPASFCPGLTLRLKAHVEAEGSPNPEVKDAELTLVFDAEGKAEGTLSLPAKACYTMKLEGLPTNYSVKSGEGGFQIDEVMCMNRGVNTLDMVIDDEDTTQTGSGFGDVTIAAQDSEGNAVDSCSFNYNSDHLDSTCTVDANGVAACSGIAEGDYTVDISCADGTLVAKSFAFKVIQDADPPTAYTATVEATENPTTGFGELCLTATDSNMMGLACGTVDFLQLPVSQQPNISSMGPTGCDSTGDHHYAEVLAGAYDIALECGNGLKGQVDATVVAEQSAHVWAMLSAPVADGVLCVGKFGLPLDLNTLTTNMGTWLGYGSGGVCVQATAQQLAGMSVTAFEQIFSSVPQGSCTDMNDSNCTIAVNGLVVSMANTMDPFNGYASGEQRVFEVTVTDSNMATTKVYIDTVNGYFQPPANAQSNESNQGAPQMLLLTPDRQPVRGLPRMLFIPLSS